jgi:putative oxidoreductase
MLGAIFVASGARELANPEMFVPRAKRVTDRIAPVLEKTDPRLPTSPRTLVQLNGAIQFGGGLLLASGHATRPAAAVLAGSLVPTTIAGHPFWAYEDAVERRAQRVNFMKNVGLLGGLLLAAADTEGRPGLRWRAERFLADRRRGAKRAAWAAKRTARTARREARIAVKATEVGRRLAR